MIQTESLTANTIALVSKLGDYSGSFKDGKNNSIREEESIQ
jgi:hypothetical protein